MLARWYYPQVISRLEIRYANCASNYKKKKNYQSIIIIMIFIEYTIHLFEESEFLSSP